MLGLLLRAYLRIWSWLHPKRDSRYKKDPATLSVTGPLEWVYDAKPAKPGWYPTLLCWDGEEGAIPSATEWRGEWLTRSPVVAYLPAVCYRKDVAEKLAYDHDPDEPVT